MRTRIAVAFVGISLALVLVSGLRLKQVEPADLGYAISQPICGPLIDQSGQPAGDAGACPTIGPMPEQLVWRPFWED